ncbi:MAG TPA: LuxR C-terminal-related transcriptional regulator [Arachnia sp.]|nr:LuxR C-terminal-related transcriptional regulator [Arachnia sp.]HMT87349.1 LuxR C-terminal-related transcriptional regulator [Arachnia sp.]
MVDIRPVRRELIDSAVADARAGRPRLLRIEGASGMGKTTHLRTALDAARGFRIIESDCDERPYRKAYGLLERLGVPRTVTERGDPHAPAVAAQSLRRVIDTDDDRPLAIAVDDAQWADHESLEAIRLVLERAVSDRLLVIVASRPLPVGEPAPLLGHGAASMTGSLLTLDGIDRHEAGELVRAVMHGAVCPDDLLERLWQHTDRNPMHLASLVTQYGLDRLAALTDLPAPREVAQDLNARLAAMDADAARLLRATAVAGSSWVDRFDAAAIAQVDDPSSALALLHDSGLIVTRSAEPLADIRVAHALVRAAVYQSTPPAERRAMHRRASQVVLPAMQRLEHAVAASERRDEALSNQLEDAALAAHQQADHRRESQLWQWASQLTASLAERERRWLESQLATVLARDTRAARARLEEVGDVGDVARRDVLMAWLLVVENRIANARHTLEAMTPDTLDQADPEVLTRWRTLMAWTMLASGYPTEPIRVLLDELPGVADLDRALRPFYRRAAGEIALRSMDADHWRQDLTAIPADARTTPMDDTDKLAWRGAVYAVSGFVAEARRDLSETVSRIRSGRVDGANGVPHALHGLALWLDGEFERTCIELQAATALSPATLHPLVQAVLPLIPAVRGDLARADALLGETEAVLVDLPWKVPVSVHVLARIARLHAGQDAAARAACLPRLRARFGADVASPDHPGQPLGQLHLGLAHIWAGDLDNVEAHLAAIETDLIVPAWSRWCRPWLSGLRSERAGRLDEARRFLDAAVAAFTSELPLYRGHVHADLARVSALTGDQDAAARSTDRARQLYAGLGATVYLAESRDPRLRNPGLRDVAPASGDDPLGSLSDREREVAALLLSGFSYAQIAEELYVTRSTVAFHLGRIYAKTGVESRHQFIRQVRMAQPAAR